MGKTKNILVILTLCCTKVLFSQNIDHKYIGHISLTGSTNINEFKFYNTIEDVTNNKFSLTREESTSDSLIYQLFLKTQNFKSDNKAMVPDFLELLKSDEYPYITVTVLQKNGDYCMASNHKNITIKLTLAGVQKQYNVNCNLVKAQNNTYYIKGEQPILLSDFNLIAPSKFLGLIRVNEKVIVNFAIKTKNPQNYHNEIQYKNTLWTKSNDGNCEGR